MPPASPGRCSVSRSWRSSRPPSRSPPRAPMLRRSAWSPVSVTPRRAAAPSTGSARRTFPVIAPVNARGEVAFFARLVRGDGRRRHLPPARRADPRGGPGRRPGARHRAPLGFGKHPTPALSDGGLVAFAAAMAGGKAVEGIFSWSAGRLRPVALTGTAAPGMPSSVLAGLDSPAVNARGDIVFLATIRRGRESARRDSPQRGRHPAQGRGPGRSRARRAAPSPRSGLR